MKKLIILPVSLLIFSNLCFSEPAKSHNECLKLTSSNWGSNVGEEWHRNEAIYWGCRLGVTSETVHLWQDASDNQGLTQEIIPAKIEGHEIVIMELMAGSAHCYTVVALEKIDAKWTKAWELPSEPNSMDHCTLACPPLELAMSGKMLSVKSPSTSDLKEDMTFSCKHVSWYTEHFVWTGKSFEQLVIKDAPNNT